MAVLAWLAAVSGLAVAGDDKDEADKARDAERTRSYVRGRYPGLGKLSPYDYQFAYNDVRLVSDDPRTKTKKYVREGKGYVEHALFIDNELASIRQLTLMTSVPRMEREKEAFRDVNATATQLGKPTVEGTEGLPEDERKITALYRAWVAEEEGLKFESAVRVTESRDGWKQGDYWLYYAATDLKAGKKDEKQKQAAKAGDAEALRAILRGYLPDMQLTPRDYTRKYNPVHLVAEDPKTNTKQYAMEGPRFGRYVMFVDDRMVSLRDLTLIGDVSVGKDEAVRDIRGIGAYLSKPNVEGAEGLPEAERKVTLWYKAWVVEELGLKFEAAVRVKERPDGNLEYWKVRAVSDVKALNGAGKKDK